MTTSCGVRLTRGTLSKASARTLSDKRLSKPMIAFLSGEVSERPGLGNVAGALLPLHLQIITLMNWHSAFCQPTAESSQRDKLSVFPRSRKVLRETGE